MNNLDRAVRVLNEHWSVAQESGQADEAECCVRALADRGLLASDLPAPDVTSANNTYVWSADGTNPVTCTGGLTPVRMWILGHAEYIYTPAAARTQAHMLLAAADYAEQQESTTK